MLFILLLDFFFALCMQDLRKKMWYFYVVLGECKVFFMWGGEGFKDDFYEQ